MDLARALEEGGGEFIEAIRGVSEQAAMRRLGSGVWSVLECVEHVVAVEERFLEWLVDGETIRRKVRPNLELRLALAVRNRETKVEAPEAVRPCGRFQSLAEAVAGFEAARRRCVQFVRERGDGLYEIGVRHPFFGKLNGVEMARLMDAHARRHAEQIQETLEAPEGVSMKKKKTAEGFRRDVPDLPAEMEEGSWEEGEFVSVEERRLADVERPEARIGELRIEGSVLERVQLGGSEIGALVLKDVRLVGCDLANVRAHRVSLLRVELIDCRLTGFSAAASEWKDVLVERGDLRYAQMQSGMFGSCEFVECNLQDADMQRADLSGCVVRGCDLGRADFRGARLRDADFRQSEVEGMVAEVGDLQGAIVEPSQAMVFARLMGLQIR